MRAFADWRPADSQARDCRWLAPSPTRTRSTSPGSRPGSGSERLSPLPRRLGRIALAASARRTGLRRQGSRHRVRAGHRTAKPQPALSRTSRLGGSSTGSAAAVAAGFCDVSVGTDSGGSIRWPAIYCGATALRLTPRPRWLAGVHAVSPSMESVGLVTRSAADLAWLWRTYRLADRAAIAARAAPRVGCGSASARRRRAAARRGRRAAAGGRRRARRRTGTPSSAPRPDDVWERRADAWELLSREAYDSFGPLLRPRASSCWPDTRRGDRGRRRHRRRTLAALRRVQQRASARRLAALLSDELRPARAAARDRAARPGRPRAPRRPSRAGRAGAATSR